MLTKINRAKCLAKYPNFPQFIYNETTGDYEPVHPDTFDFFILTLPAKTLNGHLNGLIKSLVKVIELMDYPHLTFLGDFKTAWRYQDNDYPPVQHALQYLIDNGVGKRFNGALQVSRAELPVFISHLFWLTRCNASLPDFYFSDPNQSIVGTLCKHGNIRLSVLNELTDHLLDDAINQTKFEYIPPSSDCDNLFDRTSAKRGRQVVI